MDRSCLCMRCMRETGGFEVCMHCGHINGSKVAHHSHLAPGTILAQGRYMLGTSVYFSDKEVWYAGFDFSSQRRVYIRECLVQQLMTRPENSACVYAVDADSGEKLESAKRQFRTGLTAAMRLNAKGIVSVFDIFEENNTVYAVTEWLDGMMLSDFLIKNPVCSSPAAIKNIALQLACAIQNLNEEGYVHTNLTPESIWMCSDGTTRLVGFFSMQSMSRRGKERQLSSSALVAPEVYDSGARLSPAADVYSFAALLYKLLCGNYPPAALEREAYDNYTGLRFISSDMPAPMAKAIDKALSLEPTARYKDIDRFMSAFMEDYATVETLDAAALKKKGAKRAKVRAVPVIAAILAMILGLMLVLTSVSLYTVKLHCTPELSEAFELAAAAVNTQNRLCGFKAEKATAGADVFMYSPEANKAKLVSVKNMCVDVEDGSVLAQYIQQNGSGVCLPLGYSVYIICVNTDLADDTFTAAEIAGFMLNTDSVDDEDKQAAGSNQTNGDGTGAPQPESATGTDSTEAAQDPKPTATQTLDLTPESTTSTGGQSSTLSDILNGIGNANSAGASGGAKPDAAVGVDEHDLSVDASKLVCIMPEAYGALDYLYGEGAASRLYAAQKRSFENALDAFAAGEAAYMITSSANYAKIMQKANMDGIMSFKLMLLWLPEDKAYPVHAQLCISGRTAMDSRKAEAAAMFINALAGKDAQASIFISRASTETGIVLPVNKEVRNEVLTKKYQIFFGKTPNAFDIVYFVD